MRVKNSQETYLHFHTYFKWNMILLTTFHLICNQTEFRLVPKQKKKKVSPIIFHSIRTAKKRKSIPGQFCAHCLVDNQKENCRYNHFTFLSIWEEPEIKREKFLRVSNPPKFLRVKSFAWTIRGEGFGCTSRALQPTYGTSFSSIVREARASLRDLSWGIIINSLNSIPRSTYDLCTWAPIK